METIKSFEYSIRYRLLDESGHPTTMRWRFFGSARLAHDFLNRLDSLDSRQAVSVTIARRENGPWQYFDRLALESSVAEEGGGL